MNNYILKINKRFIGEFKNRVVSKINALIVNSNRSVLKTILEETNTLLRVMSGRVTSFKDIPALNDHPSSEKINDLVKSFEIDLYKLYQTTDYIHNDTQNLLNYNAVERGGIINNLSIVQDKILSAQVKLKKDISGTTIFTETFKTDVLSDLSSNVSINIDAGVLMLKTITTSTNKVRKAVDHTRVSCGFIDEVNSELKAYPSNNQLSSGSKLYIKSEQEYHNKNRFNSYSKGLGVEPADSIKSCQFESIITFDKKYNIHPPLREKIESYIADKKGIPSSFIVIDNENSLSGKYISSLVSKDRVRAFGVNYSGIKIMIPFYKRDTIYNAIYLDFLSNGNNDTPIIDVSNSFIYNNNGNRIGLVGDKANSIDNSNIGKFRLNSIDPTTISYAEIVIRYSKPNFYRLSQFYMSEFKYNLSTNITVPTSDGGSIVAPMTDIKYIYVEKDTGVSSNKPKAKAVLESKEVK